MGLVSVVAYIGIAAILVILIKVIIILFKI